VFLKITDIAAKSCLHPKKNRSFLAQKNLLLAGERDLVDLVDFSFFSCSAFRLAKSINLINYYARKRADLWLLLFAVVMLLLIVVKILFMIIPGQLLVIPV